MYYRNQILFTTVLSAFVLVQGCVPFPYALAAPFACGDSADHNFQEHTIKTAQASLKSVQEIERLLVEEGFTVTRIDRYEDWGKVMVYYQRFGDENVDAYRASIHYSKWDKDMTENVSLSVSFEDSLENGEADESAYMETSFLSKRIEMILTADETVKKMTFGGYSEEGKDGCR